VKHTHRGERFDGSKTVLRDVEESQVGKLDVTDFLDDLGLAVAI
jgi:hypothetical protein